MGSAVQMKGFRRQRLFTGLARLIADKPIHPLGHEARLPSPNDRLRLAGPLHDLRRAVTSGRQKDDICPPNVLLWTIAIGNHGLKLVTVGAAQLDVRSLVHPLDSHTRVLQGIPKRIDLVH